MALEVLHNGRESWTPLLHLNDPPGEGLVRGFCLHGNYPYVQNQSKSNNKIRFSVKITKKNLFRICFDRSIDDGVKKNVATTTTLKRHEQWCGKDQKRSENDLKRLENHSKTFQKLYIFGWAHRFGSLWNLTFYFCTWMYLLHQTNRVCWAFSNLPIS